MTPMKKMKHNIANLNEIIKEEFSVNELQAREQRTENDYNYETPYVVKEIVSDFMYIYNNVDFETNNSNKSFAIVYDYIDKPEEEHTIQLSILKNKEERLQSPFFSVKDFSTKMKELNRQLKGHKKENPNSKITKLLFQNLEAIFLTENYDLDNEVQMTQNKIESFLNQKKEELGVSDLEIELKEKQDYLEKHEKLIKDTIENSEDYKEMLALEEKLLKLKEKISTDTATLEDDYFIPNTKKSISNLEREIAKSSEELKNGEDKILKQSTAVVRNKIKKLR